MCSLTPQCDAHQGAWLRGRKHTAELDSVVGCTPRSLTMWLDVHRGVFGELFITWLRGMMHTAESDSVVGCTQQSFWRTFHHLTLQCDAHRGVWLRGMMHIAESDSAVGCTPQSFLKIEYLGEIKTEFEKSLACLSGAKMGSNYEKNSRSKISWHTPFSRESLLLNSSVDNISMICILKWLWNYKQGLI